MLNCFLPTSLLICQIYECGINPQTFCPAGFKWTSLGLVSLLRVTSFWCKCCEHVVVPLVIVQGQTTVTCPPPVHLGVGKGPVVFH